MNIFNRIIMVILLLFLVAISVVGIVNLYADLFTWAEIPSLVLDTEVEMNTYIATAVLAGILIISIILLVFELRRRRPRKAIISSSSMGRSTVTTDSISKQINSELLKLDEIKDVKSKTIAKKNKIIADIYAKVVEGQDLSQMTEMLRDVTNDFLTEKLGLNVAKIEFTITGFVPEKAKAEPSEEDMIITQVKAALQKEEETDVPEEKEEEIKEKETE
ncbi:MAG: alkaline shock response membrane anchor protein AmaP [Actinomycetota bacterium]